MVKVLGIGGFFFRSKDPAALADWYNKHLGIAPVPTSPQMMPWMQEAGATVFAPFPADTDYFPAECGFELNFRVADLDAALADLRAAGIESDRSETMEGVGRFARIYDPEGNPIELWEPV